MLVITDQRSGGHAMHAATRPETVRPSRRKPAADAGVHRAAATATARRPAPLIRLRGVTKIYGSGQAALMALNGVDLDIDAGEFVAIMGPSGSGKSTAMNILGCLDTPTAGEYLFRGMHVERLSRDQRARLRRRYLGFVFQGFNLLARTSAQENVELPLLYRGESAATRHALARKALAAVGLDRLGAPHPGRTVGRPAAARGDRPRHRHRAGGAARRRAHRQPRHRSAAARSWSCCRGSMRDHGITVLMVTHEPDMAAYARRVDPLRRRPHRQRRAQPASARTRVAASDGRAA